MPRLIMHGVSIETVKTISKQLVDDLAKLTGTTRDHFTIQVCQDSFIFDGAKICPEPFVEISLFERGQAVEDTMANIVTKHLREQGLSSVDVYINHLMRRRYFENGDHF